MAHQGDTDDHLPGVVDDAASGVDEAVMGLLHDHVPLTLLVDLVDAPPSEQVLVEEGIPAQRWWEPADEPVDEPAHEAADDEGAGPA